MHLTGQVGHCHDCTPPALTTRSPAIHVLDKWQDSMLGQHSEIDMHKIYENKYSQGRLHPWAYSVKTPSAHRCHLEFWSFETYPLA